MLELEEKLAELERMLDAAEQLEPWLRGIAAGLVIFRAAVRSSDQAMNVDLRLRFGYLAARAQRVRDAAFREADQQRRALYA